MKRYFLGIAVLILIIVACQRIEKQAQEEKLLGQPVIEQPRSAALSIDFPQKVDLMTGYVYSIAVADFNNDGYDDIAVGIFSGATKLFVNNKDDTFSEVIIVPEERNTQKIAALDFDKDGFMDLMQGNDQEESFLLRNNHDNTFSEYLEIEKTVVNDLAVADFDSNGYDDIAIGTQFKDNFVYFNDNGVFTKVEYSSGFPVDSIAAGDMDNDRRPDIILGLDMRMSRIYASEGRQFAFSTELNGIGHTKAVAVVDVNSDGYLDIIEGNNKGDNKVLINKQGSFEVTNMFGSGNTYALIAADLDADGYDEVIVGNYEQKIQIYKKGNGEYYLVKELDTTNLKNYVRALAVGDFNKDGLNDLVVARETEPTQVYLS